MLCCIYSSLSNLGYINIDLHRHGNLGFHIFTLPDFANFHILCTMNLMISPCKGHHCPECRGRLGCRIAPTIRWDRLCGTRAPCLRRDSCSSCCRQDRRGGSSPGSLCAYGATGCPSAGRSGPRRSSRLSRGTGTCLLYTSPSPRD